MNRLAITLRLLLAVVGTFGCGCASMSRWISTPSESFADSKAPPPPDYSKGESWAALPWSDSVAEALPPGVERVPEAHRTADVFFVHPTTYFWRCGWNGGTDGFVTQLITDTSLLGQASAFNTAGLIYAPRYRQMTLSGFDHPEVREAALDLAYSDVRRAFEYYLDNFNVGRPIVLAGHSQGSRHILRLLSEFFVGNRLSEQLVAAYAVGARVWTGPYERGAPSVPICGDAQQVGCLVSWRTFARGADAGLDENVGESPDGVTVCVNPLTWKYDDVPAAPSLNLGSIPIPTLGGLQTPVPGLVGAQCRGGYLWINEPQGCDYEGFHPEGNYHAYDVALFYGNIRQNARARVDAFERNRGGGGEDFP